MKNRILSGKWDGFYPGDWVRPRNNLGTWIPLIDTAEILAGNRSVSRKGIYNLYDAPIGIALKIEEALKAPIMFEKKPDWETDYISPSSIWKENEQYHMLYSVDGEMAYAISKDCYHWTRPELGEVEHNGSRKNNFLANAPHGQIFEDPSAPPEERYKSMEAEGHWYDPDTWERLEDADDENPGKEAAKRWAAMQYEGPNYKGPKVVLRGWLVGWTSPNRLHGWKRIEKPLADYSVNGGISARYEPESQSYFAYMQPQGFPPIDPKGIGTGIQETEIVRRTNGFSRTKNFRHWPPPKLIMHPDSQDALDISFYSHNYFPYPGHTDIHCMTTSIFHQTTGQKDVQIAFSRDGLFWYRPERKAIIPLGSVGSGEEGMIGSWNGGLIKLPDNHWGVAYTGTSILHNIEKPAKTQLFPERQPGKMGWALWEPYRFCGIEAITEGQFTIPTIYRHNKELRLNYRCKPGGWISIELLHIVPSMFHGDIEPLTNFTFENCDRLTGNSLNKTVTWNGKSNISEIGKTVAIRLKMFQAKVFAYQI